MENIKLGELNLKEFNCQPLTNCFYVEFDELGQPLYRVSIDEVFEKLMEVALIKGLQVNKENDSLVFIYPIDEEERRIIDVKKASITAARALEHLNHTFNKLPTDVKNLLNNGYENR